jgi:hypothetical protein
LNAGDNCAVVAIAAVTGEAREYIAAGIAGFPAYDGGPAFVGDAVKTWSLARYLVESRGWEMFLSSDRPSIPWTCVVGTQEPAHCFAIVDGHIHDGANADYDGATVVFLFVPPGGG